MSTTSLYLTGALFTMIFYLIVYKPEDITFVLFIKLLVVGILTPVSTILLTLKYITK